ncbi:MAG TPA: histidine kinase [Gaiellaceae bacterium]|nr:histidine kinase [Gaiellaceae bacterium]
MRSRDSHRDDYTAWLLGEILLFGLLGASLALFASNPVLRTSYELPELRLVIATVVTLAGAVVAILAGVRFTVEGRRTDLLLSSGFFVASLSTFAFAIVPTLDGSAIGSRETWADVGGRVLAAALIAIAPFAEGRTNAGRRALRGSLAAAALALVLVWGLAEALAHPLPDLDPDEGRGLPPLLTLAISLQAVLALLAVIGFGLRFRRHGEDLDRWLALGATFLLFAALHFVFAPLVSSSYVSQGDFLRLLGYAVLLVGVWHAIRSAEFGRAVAEERARVAREIHDGLAQYLFAVSTHATMLENGAPPETAIPRLKEAAAAAQQEARFAVLALSSASGNAPFDAALRRYVDFLTADGALEVELEVDAEVKLAPDEQIEIFRIVQEGLANVRKHAGATRAEVLIGQTGTRRFVRVTDDGSGIRDRDGGAGQGLKNMRQRAETIDGSFALRSRPGRGTSLEVVLRA